MSKYADMSDKELSSSLYYAYHNRPKQYAIIRSINHLNDPKVMWDIMVTNGISLTYWGDFWIADIQIYTEIGIEYEDVNPLRAVCICYLEYLDYLQENTNNED